MCVRMWLYVIGSLGSPVAAAGVCTQVTEEQAAPRHSSPLADTRYRENRADRRSAEAIHVTGT